MNKEKPWKAFKVLSQALCFYLCWLQAEILMLKSEAHSLGPGTGNAFPYRKVTQAMQPADLNRVVPSPNVCPPQLELKLKASGYFIFALLNVILYSCYLIA